MIPITQSMIANPGGYYLPGAGDYYLAEDLVYLHGYGSAIQSSAGLSGKVRIFCRGRTLKNLPGGGPWAETTATGVSAINADLELYDCPSIEGFMRPVSAVVISGQYELASHWFEDVGVTGYFLGIEAQGTKNTFRNVLARGCGGGAFPARPIGIANHGPAPRFINADVIDMVKGPNDTETMHYHVLDGGEGGVMVNCTAHNKIKHPGGFGTWWNTTGDFRIEGGTFAGMQIPLSGDLAAGDLRGRAFNYDTLSTLGSGPVLAFT